MNVDQIMTETVTACTPQTTMAAAALKMWENDCGVLPVVEDGRVVGMITDRDICIATATRHRLPSEMQVADAMSPDPAVCRADDDVAVALATMAERKVRRLPVVDEAGELKGILSMNDVILQAEKNRRGKKSAVTFEDVMTALKSIDEHWIPASVKE